jgi:hypothetical protein
MCVREDKYVRGKWQQRWARDGRISKQQQCGLVVKREKSKTHEAQTTSIGRYRASQERAGAAGSVHGHHV